MGGAVAAQLMARWQCRMRSVMAMALHRLSPVFMVSVFLHGTIFFNASFTPEVRMDHTAILPGLCPARGRPQRLTDR